MRRLDGQPRKHTTPKQIAYIRKHWATSTCGEIEAAIGVRRATVKAIASRLGLEKDAKVLSEIRSRAGSHAHDRTKWRSHRANPWRLIGLQPIELPAVGVRINRIEVEADALEEMAA